MSAVDPIYVEARRVLLDALVALAPHRQAFVVAGAQAVYLRAGESELALAPYTTDGDLALDPTALTPDPALEAVMRGAGFELSTEPGIWVARAVIAEKQVAIPVDLIVPEGFAPPGGRRGARLGPHGNRAARRARGLEAAIIDKDPMRITALDTTDQRAVTVDVAGIAALLVAKAHKLHDRAQRGRADRLDDKDAADVFRLMQVSSPASVGATLAELGSHEIAGPPTTAAIGYLEELFGRRGRAGIQMASRALQGSIPQERVMGICVAYIAGLLELSGH
ncbi:MAG: hypothetical protein ACP5H2_06095 [Solirubrobacteraceae bacterium]